MNDQPIKILLVEDNAVQIILIKAMLQTLDSKQSYLKQLELICATQLSEGLLYLADGDVDIVLLDLSLPDTDGLETILTLREHNQDVPVVILTSHDDEALAVEALQSGAQDYLVKGQINREMLVRSLRYALERHRLMCNLSFMDDLTGLYNRRGFMAVADQHLKLSRRTRRECLLLYADMDGLKQINDTYGHQEGSNALKKVADVLRAVFRDSDIISRLGGDEYTILMLDASAGSGSVVAKRLQEHLDRHNAGTGLLYELSLSLGMVRVEPEVSHSLEELIAASDKEMYENKRSKRLPNRNAKMLLETATA
jgi:diguanylate cyclase (GGDEF)-like protein